MEKKTSLCVWRIQAEFRNIHSSHIRSMQLKVVVRLKKKEALLKKERLRFPLRTKKKTEIIFSSSNQMKTIDFALKSLFHGILVSTKKQWNPETHAHLFTVYSITFRLVYSLHGKSCTKVNSWKYNRNVKQTIYRHRTQFNTITREKYTKEKEREREHISTQLQFSFNW